MKTAYQLEETTGALWLIPENEKEQRVLERLEVLISPHADCYFEKTEGENEHLFIDLPSWDETNEEQNDG